MNGEVNTTKKIVIDGSLITTKEEFYDFMRLSLGSDILIGSNLDALHDAKNDVLVDIVECEGVALSLGVVGDGLLGLLVLEGDIAVFERYAKFHFCFLLSKDPCRVSRHIHLLS